MGNGDKQFHVLFVCSGNTCRSPMAETVLRRKLADTARDAGVIVESAGVFAVDGTPMTPDAQAALERAGVPPGSKRSRRLSAAMVAGADLILVMEPAHRQAVLALDPRAEPRVHLLHAFGFESADPRDVIHDPYGGSPEVYDEALGRIRRHVERVHEFLEERVFKQSRH